MEKNNKDQIRIAIPSKGRLSQSSIKLLEQAGIRVELNGNPLLASTSIEDIVVVFARAGDIPRYVASGSVELGISGTDMLEESGIRNQVFPAYKLGFGKCSVCFAGKPGMETSGTIRIATKLRNTTQKFCKAKGIDCEVIPMEGSLEAAPMLGVAEFIVDQVSTGSTLKANGLVVLEKIMDSEACLLVNPGKKSSPRIRELLLAFKGIVDAREKVYLMVNVPSQEIFEKVVAVLPSMESPTVLKLAKEGEYCLHSVVDRRDLMATIRKLKDNGGQDILVTDIIQVVK